MQLDIGTRVDRYTLVEKIGEGGMAVVFRVEHATLGTPHALKVLTMGGRQVKDRLVQEGRVQATLQHPHIVSVTDVLDIDGAPGLLMEYVDGPSLDDWLNKYRPTIDEAVILFRGIVAGVGLAHARGLIHRDLKPGNVMLHVTNIGVVPKVCDFGLAKVTDGSDGGNLKRTRTGMTMGTPAYMAPEQIRDSSSVDRRADLYSLGCILYELLSGKTPFDGSDMLSLFAAIAMGEYTPIQELVPDVPDNVAAVVEALLVDDVDTRLSDCAAIFDLLDGRESNVTGFFPTDGELGAPAPIGATGVSVLDLKSAAADVARAMTRGVQMPDEISQVGWTSTVNSSPSALPTEVRSAAPEVESTTVQPKTFDEDTSLVIPVATKAAGVAVLGGAGLLVFGVAVVLSIGLTWLYLQQAPSEPTGTAEVTDPVVPEPVVPEPVIADPEPVIADPEPVAPDPEPVVPKPSAPEPVPVAPPPAPVAPSPVPVAPDPAPVAPAPVPVPEPERPPEPSPTGSFRFTGATKVELYNANARFGAGAAIPPGRYRIRVDGVDGGSAVTIRAGATVTLACVAVMGTCRSR